MFITREIFYINSFQKFCQQFFSQVYEIQFIKISTQFDLYDTIDEKIHKSHTTSKSI